MALITIDGVKLEVPEHKCVLECALRAGIYIPHLCHHPDLPEKRVLPPLRGRGGRDEGAVPSCTLKAKDGMVVHIKSERLSKLRSMALELLLAGHPEDCSTCPKYGSCELQTLMQYLGGAGSPDEDPCEGLPKRTAPTRSSTTTWTAACSAAAVSVPATTCGERASWITGRRTWRRMWGPCMTGSYPMRTAGSARHARRYVLRGASGTGC